VIGELKPYPAYKDSGVPWLGGVPQNWRLAPALAAYSPKFKRNLGMAEKTVLSLSYGRIVVKPPEKLHGLVPESFETYQIVDPGDIIVRTTDLQNDRTSLRVGLSQNRGIITSAYMCLATTDAVTPVFGYQFLNAYDLLKIIYGYGSGLRQNLDFGGIKRMPVLIPPATDQIAIIRYLDYADRRIRHYIRARQKLIALLNEQKQAIIHHAVTRGLDPNVPLKPSGVEWLGDVPAYWNLTALKHACLLLRDGTHVPPPRQEEGLPLLSVRNIVRDRLERRIDDSYISKRDFDLLCRSFEPKRHDVLMAIVGATLGKVAVVEDMEPFQIQRSVAVLRANPQLLHFRFLADFLRGPAFQTALWTTVAFSAQPGIYLQTLGSFPIALPPIEEQRKIADNVERSLVRLSDAISKASGEIDVIREYRTRLIADVVTGKLDVREAATNLPDETEEDEPADSTETNNEEGEEVETDALPEEVGA
jgi:type I restriction enzyme, S subunit